MPSFYPHCKCLHPSKPSACFVFAFLICHILPWSLCVCVCACVCVSVCLCSLHHFLCSFSYCSITKSRPALWNPIPNSFRITQSFLVLHSLPESAQTHVHWVSDAIQPSQPCPLLHLTSVLPSIRVFSNKLALCIRWPKYWSLSFSPFSEYSALISFRIGGCDLIAVQGQIYIWCVYVYCTLKSPL